MTSFYLPIVGVEGCCKTWSHYYAATSPNSPRRRIL